MRAIIGDADVADGVTWLIRADPRLALAFDLVGPLPLRRRDDGFGALLAAVVGQQVSVASASAILSRCEAAGLLDPDVVSAADNDALRACGLSRQKMRTVRALAAAGIDFDGLRTATTEEVVATLTVLPGIGRWTAEIYAMFSLGHADAFASGDLALQEGARLVLELPNRPKAGELAVLAQVWSPWRSVAARLLWAYYAHAKTREGIR